MRDGTDTRSQSDSAGANDDPPAGESAAAGESPASETGRSDTEPTSGGDPALLTASQQLLRAIRAAESAEPAEQAIATASETDLESLSHEERLAFWCNVYNAATQLLMDRRPDLYGSKIRFFRAEAITVAGTSLSLDAIEHGILRDSAKYGLGYVPRIFGSRFERRHRLGTLDRRIHFALNCGAGSCPPIAAYSAAIDEELDLAAGGYLEATVQYDPQTNVARVPRVCLWYRGDFGGPAGVREMLAEYDVIPADADPAIEYLDWDWSPNRRDFTELGF